MIEKRNVVGFYALSDLWRIEALKNLGEDAEASTFLEPKENHKPEKDILWDLDTCEIRAGHYKGFDYNGVITISNNATMLIQFDDTMETARIIIV